jgi:uncharacterized protein (TIGR03067 family)
MQTRVLCVLAIFGIAAGIPSRAGEKDQAEAVKKEMAALKGEWKLVSQIIDGKKTPPETFKKNRVSIFDRGKYTIRDGKAIVAEFAFKIDPSKNPKWFDATTMTNGSPYKGQTQYSIYKIEGDTLTLCIARISYKIENQTLTFTADPRPTDFTSKTGSGRVLSSYQRQKK